MSDGYVLRSMSVTGGEVGKGERASVRLVNTDGRVVVDGPVVALILVSLNIPDDDDGPGVGVGDGVCQLIGTAGEMEVMVNVLAAALSKYEADRAEDAANEAGCDA